MFLHVYSNKTLKVENVLIASPSTIYPCDDERFFSLPISVSAFNLGSSALYELKISYHPLGEHHIREYFFMTMVTTTL